MKQVKNSLLVLFVLLGAQLHGQTNAEKALTLGNEAVELIKTHTRQYAKRQLTFFNKNK